MYALSQEALATIDSLHDEGSGVASLEIQAAA